MRKKYRIIELLAILIILNIQAVYADSKSDIVIEYNTKVLDLGDKECITNNNSTYVPLRVFSENLYYNVEWNSDLKFARIYDNLNDIYVYMNGKVKINGLESNSQTVPLIINGTTYVPLRFISENLGVTVDWNSKSKTVVMSGRSIYDIENNKLISYTKNGKQIIETFDEKPSDSPIEMTVESVNRTKYSDIVTTYYISSGAITRTNYKQLYIKDNKLIYSTNYKSQVSRNVGVKYYDDRVAFLTSNDAGNMLIKIFDDKTSTLVKTINTNEEYNEVLNIQGVGENFIVVNMLQTNKFNPEELYMTTVIDLDAQRATPIYEKTTNQEDYCVRASSSNMYLNSGSAPDDGIYLNSKDGNKLNFICIPMSNNIENYQYTLED